MNTIIKIIFDTNLLKERLYTALYGSSQDEYTCHISKDYLILYGDFLELAIDPKTQIKIGIESNTDRIVKITWERNSIERLVSVLQSTLHQPAVLRFNSENPSERPLLTIEV